MARSKLEKNVKCPNCKKYLRLSNLNENKWICGKCNSIYEDKDLNFENTIYDTVLRRFKRLKIK